MTISRDSQREIARVKREMFSAGKGDATRTKGDKFLKEYSKLECATVGCGRMRIKWSNYCSDHTTEMTQEKN